MTVAHEAVPPLVDGPRGSMTRKSLALLSRDVAVTAVRFVATVYIARRLGPAAMGVWLVLTMIPSYAEAFARLKADLAAIYFVGAERYDAGRVALGLNVIAVVTGTAVIGIGWLGQDLIFEHLLKSAPGTRPLILVMLACVPLHFLYLNYGYLLLQREDVSGYNRMTVLREGTAAVLPVILLAISDAGVTAVVVPFLVAVAGATAYGMVRVHRVVPLTARLDLAMLARLCRYSAALYAAGLVSQLNVYLSATLVALYLSPAQVAFFRLAQDKAQLLNRLPAAVNTLLYARIAVSGTAAAPATSARAFRMLAVVLAAAAGVGALAIQPVVRGLYGYQYAPIVGVFLVLLPGVAAAAAAGALVQYFMGTGRPWAVVYPSLAALVAQAVLGPLVIPASGPIGAAVVTSLAFVVTAVVTIYEFRVMTRASVSALVPGRDDVESLAMIARAGLVPDRTGGRGGPRVGAGEPSYRPGRPAGQGDPE
jgi:O-antigen/teichoic acid export membrane protein